MEWGIAEDSAFESGGAGIAVGNSQPHFDKDRVALLATVFNLQLEPDLL